MQYEEFTALNGKVMYLCNNKIGGYQPSVISSITKNITEKVPAGAGDPEGEGEEL